MISDPTCQCLPPDNVTRAVNTGEARDDPVKRKNLEFQENLA